MGKKGDNLCIGIIISGKLIKDITSNDVRMLGSSRPAICKNKYIRRQTKKPLIMWKDYR